MGEDKSESDEDIETDTDTDTDTDIDSDTEDEEDYIDILYKGIEYSYLDGVLYDESLNPIGEATV